MTNSERVIYEALIKIIVGEEVRFKMERMGCEGCERPASVDDWIGYILYNRAFAQPFKADDITTVEQAAIKTGTQYYATANVNEVISFMGIMERRTCVESEESFEEKMDRLSRCAEEMIDHGKIMVVLALKDKKTGLSDFWREHRRLEEQVKRLSSNIDSAESEDGEYPVPLNSDSTDSDFPEDSGNDKNDKYSRVRDSLGAISAGIDGVSTVEEGQEKPTLTDMVFNGKATARPAKDNNFVAINVRAAREAGLEYHRITDYDEACGLLIAENRRSTMAAALDVGYASLQGSDSELLEEIGPFVEGLIQNGGGVIVIEHGDGERQLSPEFYLKYKKLKDILDSGDPNNW